MQIKLADAVVPGVLYGMRPRMQRFTASLASTLEALTDYFIPPHVMAHPAALKQVRVFLISHIFGPFIGSVVPVALYILSPNPGYDVVVLSLSIAAFWLFPFALRASGAYEFLAVLSVQNLIFCILWSCYFNGGVSSPTLTWVLTIPLLGFFYLGSSPKWSLALLGLFAANLAVFYVLYLFGHEAESKIPLSGLQGLGIISTTASALYVIMMAVYYAKVLASQAELEAEMKGHLATATELRRAATEAERADAAKSEFLAKTSHELRTPLNAVIGYSQMLLEDAAAEGDTTMVDDLQRIHGAGLQLLKLISEILDLSKIEAGKMELFCEDVDIAEVVKEVAETYRGLAVQNKNELIVRISEQLGNARCDEMRIRQALSQLVDNAAKFTNGGKITISAERRATPAGDGVAISVTDTGIGIDRDAIPHLFENFTVAGDESDSKYGGTGLGLALSQKLCTMMGGKVTVSSELGAGSCFTIWLPVASAKAHEAGHSEPGGTHARGALAGELALA